MTQAQSIRVLLVDDHAVIRGGLRYFLASTHDIVVAGEATNGLQALAMVEELHPDVVLMDIMMPEMDGIATTQQLHQRFPQLRVLMLSSFSEGALVQRALQAGASGYILKDVQGHELASAIRTVYLGRPALSTEATQALVEVVSQPPKPGGDLSGREREVLNLMVAGYSNDQIAVTLDITRNTVRHHVHNILGKLDAVNRTEAVGLAVQHKLALAATAN